MSLYDGVDIDGVPMQSNSTESTDISKLSGWSSSYKLLQTQLRRKKVAQTRPVSSAKSKSVNQVVLGIKRNTEDPEDQSSDVDSRDSQDVDLKKLPEPFIETEASLSIIVDEYDPMRPNDYEVVKEKFREERDHERAERGDRHERTENRERTRNRDYDRGERHRERDRERDRDRDRDYDRGRDRDRDRERDRDYPSRERGRERGRRRNGSDDEENYNSQTSRHRYSSGAAIAPPPSLMQQEIPIPPSEQWPVSSGDYISSEKPNLGFSASPVASQIMARYGWKDGQGLGKQEQGINTCLQVEKTSKRGGKIINQDKETNKAPKEPEPVTNVLKNPSKVVVLRNMVGPGEVDDDLQPEVVEECAKYGEVVKVIIYEIPQGVPDEEAVRIFVEFQRVEAAIKALVDLNGRFFGGRTVRGAFYNLDKFRRLDLMADL